MEKNMKQPKQKMGVLLYARVSTLGQAKKELSIEDQLYQMRNWCKEQQKTILGEYIDLGRSATNDERPEFQNMIGDALERHKEIGCIVVHSFSRAFRNVDHMVIYGRTLKQKKIRLISISQPVDESPMGQIMQLIYGVMDQMFSTENSKHVKRGRRANARKGYYNGASAPFGYKRVPTDAPGHSGFRKILAIHEEEAAIVREIFDRYEGGVYGPAVGMKTITKTLNDKCTYRGSIWRVQQVQRILSDEVYTGVYMAEGRSKTNEKEDDEDD
jgi:DNA invertase Pin-like site-specific DNA recombinase